MALFEANRVVSCSAAAQAEGVRRGHRRREAQVRCPALVVAPFDADRDHRVFAPLLDRLEEVSPGIQVIRPGLVALRMRGPARYYGGELPAAIIADAVVRIIPGVIGDEQSALSDSFQDNLLAPPVYTRPAEYNGWRVPDILLSGNEAKIKDWEIEQSYERTKRLRPDLLEKGNKE